MTKILFIEGVSGAGKSTMVRALHGKLQNYGHTVKSYIEFDFKNPIDFYCTAYIPNKQFKELLRQYSRDAEQIKRYSTPAGEATLVRYYNEDTPLFAEPLLQELKAMEFCYNPPHPVPLPKYTDAYRAVWKAFATGMDNSTDYYIFDGSLLHHPINDMIRNYHTSQQEAAAHVQTLLESLVTGSWHVFYLFSEDIEGQLNIAYRNRGQTPPCNNDIAFWKTRRNYDDYVLRKAVLTHQMLNVSQYGYDAALNRILTTILCNEDNTSGA